MKYIKLTCSLFFLVFIAGCQGDDDASTPAVSVSYDFNTDLQGWTGGFVDYPQGEEDFYELSFTHAALPAPLDTTRGAVRISGNNHSDDLFMYIKRQLSGLAPNQDYQLSFRIEMATDAAEGSFGAGGSPANSVYLKAGGSTKEPIPILGADGYLEFSIDKSNQSNSGRDMLVISDFSNESEDFVYRLKVITADDLLTVRSDGQGRLWLVVGTDSGYEATTTPYYTLIDVELKPN